ncbi:MAG TPA: bifunctional diguanylate cyclase/phosphodiesterase, partial [Spongiibacteraceae bacterium]|nr:bifunctional diguanylate cyclase/phosphodiesterase [Spongiibacteraceae bacterium]
SQGFVASSYQVSDYVAELVDSAGARRWISFSSSGVIEGERLTTIISVITDISERMRYTQQLEHQASHDELTGLPNRSHFVQRVTDVAENAAAGEQWAVCLLDLDGFKEINDTLGHEMGDHLLKGLATRLGEVVGSQGGLLARVGGDEFALLYRSAGERAVCELVEAVTASIQIPFAVHDLELRIGGSVGIALFPRDGATTSALMRCADIAMYKAKTAGVDYQLYASEQDVYSIRRLSLMMDIRQAIEGDQLLLHYQPVIDFPGQRLVSFEALLRWQHPRHGLLPPGEFIPLIELTDMIESMTWWVLEAAIRQLQAWQARGWDYRVAVNISARNVADDRFAARVAGLLARYGVPARQLELEITESALMADPDKARHVLQQLDSMGVWLSIDDYGTGYSSLAYLKSLPIDTLKIDRSFISNMLQTEQDRIIVNSTIQLAHNLGMSVTAEGIEYAELIDALADLGCDKGQGYYICRPVSPSELPAWVELHRRHRYADTEQF